MPVHVGQAVVAALEFVGEPLVVNAEEVQHRRLEIVDVEFFSMALIPFSASDGEKVAKPDEVH